MLLQPPRAFQDPEDQWGQLFGEPIAIPVQARSGVFLSGLKAGASGRILRITEHFEAEAYIEE